ncbi:MAG: hypothetical protein R2762_15040 [Bryobacteraceae bacterium]
MKFAIRDDDTCYYTKPEQLEQVWGRILPYAPVSLAVTPFALRAAHLGDPVRFYQGPDSGALADNGDLVAWLCERIVAGRVSVMCHGATHEYIRTGPRTLVPECLWKPAHRIGEETGRARRHLEQTLAIPVTAFVPPGNGISLGSMMAIRPHFRRLLASVSLRRVAEFLSGADAAALAVRRVYFQLRHGIVDPFSGTLAGLRLLPSFPLTASTRWPDLERQLMLCKRLGTNFVAGVHYWEIRGPVADTLQKLLEKAASIGCRFCSCDELFAETEGKRTASVRIPPVTGGAARQGEGTPAR